MNNEHRPLRVKLFRDLPVGTVFRVLKERGRFKEGSCGKVPASPPKGWYVKRRNNVAQAYSSAREIILGFSDVTDVVAYPSEKRSLSQSR
jgi:hypothetical protein